MAGNKVIKCKGAKLFPWQADVAREISSDGYGSGNVYTTKSKRQVGKSVMCENILLWFALNKSDTYSLFIAPTLMQSRKVYEEIVKAIEGKGVMNRKNDSLLSIRFVNKSIIEFKSAEQKDALRGFTISGILCMDECSFINDDIFELLRPTCDVYNAPILLTSTPKFKLGFFYDCYTNGIKGVKGYKSFDFNNYDTSALLSKERLEMYRQTMTKAQFTSEYLGLFIDEDGQVFSEFKNCIIKPEPNELKIYGGIDWSTCNGGDYTVVTLIDEDGNMVDILHFNKSGTKQQVAAIKNFLSPYMDRMECIYSESNSIGTPMTDLLKEALPDLKITRQNTTNQSKIDMVNSLQLAFERMDIGIIEDELLMKHLASYEESVSPRSHTVTYNAPLGFHDDCCISLMYAWKCWNDHHRRNGRYAFGLGATSNNVKKEHRYR